MEQELYRKLKEYAEAKDMQWTLKALPYAKEMHKGQFRKGKHPAPYIIHPLQAATHAVALGLDDDELIAATLLHDVCEDCGIPVQTLPTSARAREAVALVTKVEGVDYHQPENAAKYFGAIGEHEIATLVKILDRCNNVSGMAEGFSREKIAEYIRETEDYVYPLMERVRKQWPQYERQMALIWYHMESVILAIQAYDV